jgi:hypothetical protein
MWDPKRKEVPVKKSLVALAVVATWALAGSGSGVASVSCAPGIAPAPSVVTDYEANVTATSATFRGKVNPHGCVTIYHFEYGATTAYGNVTSETAAGSGTSSVQAMAAITGLAPHTVYHFRIVASSDAGTTDGSDLTFRTKVACVSGGGARPPAVVTDHATAVLTTSATLRGKVNSHGCPTTYEFEYGTTTGYGKVSLAVAAGSGTRSVVAIAAISGLAQDTLYHFRIVATSGAGTTVGADERVKTLKAPSSVEIAGHRAYVKRGFVTRIHLRCTLGSLPCQGTLTILLKQRLVGRQPYLLAANSESVVLVRLNRRGRMSMRLHGTRHVELVATNASNSARAFVELVRSFRPG